MIPHVFISHPRKNDLVPLANWALLSGYRLRAIGSRCSWAPLIFSLADNGTSCPKTLLLDTKRHLTDFHVNPPDSPETPDRLSVTVGPGLTLLRFLTLLEENDLSIFACPTTGVFTIGGLLAIGAHGSGIPGAQDQRNVGHTYGTLSNLVMELTIVSWDASQGSYKLRRVHRAEKEAKAFLVNLGRAFIVSATLRVGKLQMLRSQSHFFVPVGTVFQDPAVKNPLNSAYSFSSLAQTFGRIDVITSSIGAKSPTWILTWRNEPVRGPRSRYAFLPYNYISNNYLPAFVIDPFLKTAISLYPRTWELFGKIMYPFIVLTTKLTKSQDFWGPSKNHFLYLTKYSPRLRSHSFVVLTSRRNLQLVAFTMRKHFDRLAEQYLARDKVLPPSGIVNTRVTGIDDPEDVLIPGAEAPVFSNAKPRKEKPEWDVVLWMQPTAYPSTPKWQEFSKRLQDLYLREIEEAGLGTLRVEWSKGWAHTLEGPWLNGTIARDKLPRSYGAEDWNFGVAALQENDPNNVFSNEYLDELLKPVPVNY